MRKAQFTVTRVLFSPAQGCYYVEDIQALQESSIAAKDRWNTPAVNPSYRKVREIAEAISIGIELSDGSIFWGDALSVSYAGKSGRDAVFRRDAYSAESLSVLGGRSFTSFRDAMRVVENLFLPNAINYGVSQAILQAAAATSRMTITSLIQTEWQLDIPIIPLRFHGSCGEDYHSNVDKMIVNRLDVIPHGQVDDPLFQLGHRGEKLIEYFEWLSKRIVELAGESYQPVIHFDVHGTVAKMFNDNLNQVAEYLAHIKKIFPRQTLRLESVCIQPTFERHIEWHSQLHSLLNQQGIEVEIYLDEWVNSLRDIAFIAHAKCCDGVHIKTPNLGSLVHSIESALLCRNQNLNYIFGGSCVETDISSRIAVQVALALEPTSFLARPGMGINEAIAICKNEMHRVLSILKPGGHIETRNRD